MSDKQRSISRLRGRRRSRPYLVLGLLLPALCAGAFLWISLATDDHRPVLALAREVTVGHVVTAQDLRSVRVEVDPGVLVVDAGQTAGVVGKTMSVSLPAGALLTPDAVDAPAIPVSGQAIVSLALKAGQFPAEVGQGARVAVVFVSGGTSGAVPHASAPESGTWRGVVTSVAMPPSEQVTVVSVQLAEAAAGQVAAVPVGQLSLVLVAGGGR
ncbi:SAF domain-containing protein [Lentzea aerocolonigenes]|uniref:SAF domain-containing protein n=1 Tax=Lentzea aerocolonigenes TaxID=68170 RepID=UPI001F3D2A41|nr:SAF domain-containing protein [Lentzea aerocolonigenes]